MRVSELEVLTLAIQQAIDRLAIDLSRSVKCFEPLKYKLPPQDWQGFVLVNPVLSGDLLKALHNRKY